LIIFPFMLSLSKQEHRFYNISREAISMSFLLRCPTCGERSVYEFRFGGEARPRPTEAASARAWAEYVYARENEAGVQKEWWYHQLGCRAWFLALRDTTTNTVHKTFAAEDDRQES